MKLSTYNSQVNLNTLSGQVRAPRDPNAFGANTEGMDALGKGLQTQINLMQKMQEDQDATNAMAASLEFDQKMDDALYGEDGFLRQQQQGAIGVTKKISDFAEKTRQELAQKYPFKLQKGQVAFENLLSKSSRQSINLGTDHEFKETEKYKTTVLASKVKLGINSMSLNYGNDKLLDENMKGLETQIAARYFDQGKEVVDYAINEFRAEASAAVVQAAIAAGDEKRAEQLGFKYRAFMSPDARDKSTQYIVGKQKANRKVQTIKGIADKYGDDLQGAIAAVEELGKNGVDRSAGVSFAKSQEGVRYNLYGDGSKENGTNCGILGKGALNAAGVKFESSYVPYMIKEAKDGGMWQGADYVSQAKPGDLIVVGVKQDDGTVDPEAHVVVVGENGSIIQAGTSQMKVYESSTPVTEMFPSVTGVIVAGGASGTTYSASEIEELKDGVTAEIKLRKSNKNFALEAKTSSFLDDKWGQFQKGRRDKDGMLKEAAQNAAGDFSVYEVYENKINGMFKDAVKDSEGGFRNQSDANTWSKIAATVARMKPEQASAVRDLVDNSKELLSFGDYKSFTNEINKIGTGAGDEDGRNADAGWMAEVKDKNTQINIKFRLDANNIRGWARYEQAKAWSKESGIKTYMKDSLKTKQDLYKNYSKDLVDLVELGFSYGFVDGGKTENKKYDMAEIKRFIDKTGSEYSTVPYTEDAVDWLIANAIPINPETLKRARTKIEDQKRDERQ